MTFENTFISGIKETVRCICLPQGETFDVELSFILTTSQSDFLVQSSKSF